MTDFIDPIGPPVEDLEARRLRNEAARALFDDDAPDMMRIGRFEIDSEIGSGGQGSVFRVRDPKLDRMVALKRLGIPTPRHAARMQREAQALAKISHEHVVKVFEVAEDETGRPFLVMELIEGPPLGKWLAQTRRHWTEVLDVFIGVGEGLAAIHAAGLIHRDVKPSNIVITGEDRAKLIDLGLAAAEPRRTLAEPAIGPQSATMGTWDYMAPEQRAGHPSAHSDQFAFCVTLYEALYGVRPPIESNAQSGSRLSGDRIGRLANPERPTVTKRLVDEHRSADGPRPADSERSAELPTLTNASLSSVEGLARVSKPLRRILARGLSLDPEQRYPQMTALVADLQRLRSRRRRWPAVALALLGVAVLGVAVAGREPEGLCTQPAPTTALWQGARRAAVQAAFESTESPEAETTFAAVDGMFDRTAQALDERLAEVCEQEHEPGLRALALDRMQQQHGALRSLADALVQVDAPALAETPGRLAAALARLTGEPAELCGRSTELPPNARPQIAAIDSALQRATAEAVAGRYDDAMALAADALEQAEGKALAPYRAQLHLMRGRLAFDARRLKVARDALDKTRSLADALDCDGLGAEALALGAKAEVLDAQPNVSVAEYATRIAQDKLDGLGDSSGPRRALVLDSRGLVLRHQGRYEEAIAHHQQALALRQSLQPPPVLAMSDTALNLAVAQAKQGNPEAAIETLEHARQLREQALWPDHPSLYRVHVTLSHRFRELGELAASEAALRRALELAEGLGTDHPRLAQLHISMAQLLDWRQAFGRALDHARRADAILVRTHGEDSPRRIASLEAIGQVSLDAGWPEQAVPSFDHALKLQIAAGRPSYDLAIGRGKLARAHAQAERHQTAMPLYEQAQRVFAADPSLQGDPFYPELQLRHGESLVALGREDEALAPLRLAMDWWQERGKNPARLALAQWALARALCPRDAGNEGQALAQQALAYFESLDAPHADWMASLIAEWLEQPCPRPKRLK
ncbi:MAG: serine/threonine-protein kinase [Myxococcota bacterium]